MTVGPDLVTIPRAELDSLYARLAKAEAYRENDRERSRRSHAARRSASPSPVMATAAGRPADEPRPVTPIAAGRPAEAPSPVTRDGRHRPELATGDAWLPVTQDGAGRPASRASGSFSSPNPGQQQQHVAAAERARSPAGSVGPPATADEVWTCDQVRSAARVGVDLSFERLKFEAKRGADASGQLWSVLSWVQNAWPPTSPPPRSDLVLKSVDRAPQRQNGTAATAYDHDPWAGRKPPIADVDLERYRAMGGTS